ncbi:MAG: hypothetical protein ACSLFI_11685 [Solirubrobacterales bacterium]
MGRRSINILANLDLIALAIALPVFIVAGLPIFAYVVAAGMWILSRLVHVFAERKAKENLLAGKRNTAMGTIAATSLGSAWIMALGVLFAGLISREVGLYAAILLVVVFTLNLASRGLVHLYRSDLDDQTA